MGEPGQVGGPLTRRRLLQHTAAAGLGATGWGALAAPAAKAARARAASAKTVAVFGGGVAGLSAAHELAERGYKVMVFERKALGGKARSIPVPGTGTNGRADLPAEHGFRAEFGFYQNLPDIMKRIPFNNEAGNVFGNTVNCGEAELARANSPDLTAPITLNGIYNYDLGTAWETLMSGLRTLKGIPLEELAFFVRQVLMYFTSCDERRFGQWEYVNWWDFTRAEQMTDEYRKQLADGLTRNLAAARSMEMSVNSTGLIGESFAFSLLLYQPNELPSDRVLDAPTSESWINPWVKYLQSRGVSFFLGEQLTKLDLNGGKITGAELRSADGSTHSVEADYFVSAIPVERAIEAFDAPILQACPELQRLPNLVTQWMNGVVFHLDREVDVCKGHVSYVDSQNALTSISQQQFWRSTRDIGRDYGDGRARESFSAIISDWRAPGLVYGQPLWSLPREKVIREVWEQCKQHLNDYAHPNTLTDDMVVSSFLDTAIQYPAELAGKDVICTNDEPLLINTPGSWDDRPETTTAIPNLILAADYVRNTMNCATMESACETGRRAAQAIVSAESPGTDIGVHDRWTPQVTQGLRNIDARRYAKGLPHLLDFPWDVGAANFVKRGGNVKTLARRRQRVPAGLHW